MAKNKKKKKTKVKRKKKKQVKAICGNCLLANTKTSTCMVAILHAGEQYHLPIKPSDECFFENEFTARTPEYDQKGNLTNVNQEKFKVGVEEVKWWTENPKTGKRTTGDGVVKIEYPDGFFGKEDEKFNSKN